MDKLAFKNFLYSKLKSDFLQEIVYSGIGCIGFTLLFFLFPEQSWDYPNRETICAIMITSFFLTMLILNQTNQTNKFFKVNYKRNIILFSIFNFAVMCFLYFQTPFSTNGMQGDNIIRSAYITQMASSGYPQDFAYKGFSAFLSPLYWYCLALVARTLQIRPFKMIKLGTLFVIYCLPIILFEAWKKIYSIKIAFIITSISFLFLYDFNAPDHFISLLLIIPYFMYYYENSTNKEFKRKDYAFGGLLGSIIFCTYFLYFLIIPIYYLISFIQNRNKFKENLKHILLITIFLIAFSSWFWAPLLKDIIIYGFESYQNRYFNPDLFSAPMVFLLGFSIFGSILFIGFISIIRSYGKSRDYEILGKSLFATFIVYLIGFFGILIKFPIMHLRFSQIIRYLLIISFCLFTEKVILFIKQNKILKKNKITLNIHQIEIITLILIISIQNYTIIRGTHDSVAYEQALDEDVRYDLIEVIEELDYEDKVFLTSNYKIIGYLPIYLFLLPNPYFTHPSALYNKRIKFLVDLSESETSKEFYDKILDNEFSPIDFFWLDENDNSTGFVFTVPVDDFPDGRTYYDINFRNELFNDPEYFEKIVIDGEIIYETKY